LFYRVPEQFWSAIATHKVKAGVGADGKPEQLEFRWNGCQSVVAGVHPQTGRYRWLEGRSPDEIDVAEAPLWMIEQMLSEQPAAAPAPSRRQQTVFEQWTDLDWARSYLDAIPPTEDYDQWLQVGMALHSVSEALLGDWDSWSRSAGNYEATACEKKWKSFKPGKGIGIGTLAAIAKQHGWKSPKPERTMLPMNGTTPSSNGNGNGKTAPTSPEDLNRAIEGLIHANTPQSQLEALLPQLAKQSDRTSSDVWRLYRAKVAEIEQASSRSSRSRELSQTLLLARQELRLTDYLDQRLAEPLETIAEGLGSNGAAMLTTLLPVAATLLKVGTRLELAAATRFYALPIIYTGVLAESGSAKSPTQKVILEPLFDMQSEAEDEYNNRLEDYEAAKAAKSDDIPPKPKPREYYTIDSTREAIATIQSQQPDRGFLGWFDELSALLEARTNIATVEAVTRVNSLRSRRDRVKGQSRQW
jgi:hypothetical protein